MNVPRSLFFSSIKCGFLSTILLNMNFQNDKPRLSLTAQPVFDYTLAQLIDKSENFPIKFPVTNGKTKSLLDRSISSKPENHDDVQDCMLNNWKGSYPIVHEKVISLCLDFLEFKAYYGSDIEKKLYKDLSLTDFLNRLLLNRAVQFVGAQDSYQLMNLEIGRGNWESIGTTQECYPLVLKDCLSYDEVKISALIAASSPSYFINQGDRANRGFVAPKDHQEWGIVIGAVGCRFEKLNVMEWQDMVITLEQNTEAHGYGPETADKVERTQTFLHTRMWSRLYDQNYFPTWKDIEIDDSRFKAIRRVGYFNKEVYQKRCKISAETILLEADDRGHQQNQQVFLHVVGLGLGVWRVDDIQEELFLAGFVDAITSLSLTHLTDVYFSWFSQNKCGNKGDGEKLGDVTIHFGKRNPHEKLEGVFQNKLLVCTYAWDGNALPGNEFWDGDLTSSGDPAEACSSQIAELQNPHINPMMTGSNFRVASPTLGKIVTLQEFMIKEYQPIKVLEVLDSKIEPVTSKI